MASKVQYKTGRKYKCPYCDFKATRSELIDHVDRKHAELIPEDYTADRAVYDSINGKNYGTCMICKEKVFKWNSKISRYCNLCDKPSCRESVRRTALERHMRVYNKPTLLGDPEQQEKMLAHRKISGTYIFTDGGKVTFTGQYEKNALEFMDKVLNIPSTDIQAPGPVLEYEYEGKKHLWITDIYYIPANLLIEIKDGGSNPNNRSMQSYREKQVAKEEMVTNLGTFNYIRLTNNQFDQLLNIFADMKNEVLENPSNPSNKFHINESGGCGGTMPVNHPPEAYVVPYGMNNVFDGIAFGTSGSNIMLTISSDDSIEPIDKEVMKEKYTMGIPLYYKGTDVSNKVNKIFECVRNGDKTTGSLYFAEMLLGRPLLKFEDIFLSECFRYYDDERNKRINSLIENGVIFKIKESSTDSNVIKVIGNVMICQSINGYYAVTPGDFYMASGYFSDMESLVSSDIIKLMNDIYLNNRSGGKAE